MNTAQINSKIVNKILSKTSIVSSISKFYHSMFPFPITKRAFKRTFNPSITATLTLPNDIRDRVTNQVTSKT